MHNLELEKKDTCAIRTHSMGINFISCQKLAFCRKIYTVAFISQLIAVSTGGQSGGAKNILPLQYTLLHEFNHPINKSLQ